MAFPGGVRCDRELEPGWVSVVPLRRDERIGKKERGAFEKGGIKRLSEIFSGQSVSRYIIVYIWKKNFLGLNFVIFLFMWNFSVI